MTDGRQFDPISSDESTPSTARPPDLEPQQVFPDADDYELTVRLLGYANHLLRTHKWRGTRGGEPPAGSAEDLVQTAFTKYMENVRHRPAGVSAYTFMAGIIRSELSHLLERDENVPHLTIVNGVPDSPAAVGAESIPERDTGFSDGAVFIADKWLPRLRDRFGPTSLVVRYVELIRNGTTGRAATRAEALGVTVREIFNLNRQVRRFVQWYESTAQRR